MATIDTASVCILIVEDSPTQAAQLKFLLESHGYVVMVAVNGREALKLIALHPPTLVITDVVMPDMDGYELCAAIKSDPQLMDIPVVMVTSLTGLQDITRSLECGADNFLRKPYDPTMLLSRINYILLNLEMRQGRKVRLGLELLLDGKRHFITSEREQIIGLLISTYEEAVHMNEELQAQQREIARSNQTLRGLYRIAQNLIHAATAAEVCAIALNGIAELPALGEAWIYLRDPQGVLRVRSDGSSSLLNPEAEHCPGLHLLDLKQPGTTLIECSVCMETVGQHAASPLCVEQRCLGVINVLAEGGRSLSTDDLDTLTAIANQVSVALERVALLASLEVRANQLELANKELESFSYSVSHDLRAPLRAIDGFSRMLQDSLAEALPEHERHLLSVIRESSKKMEQLIENLLTFSHLGTAPLQKTRVDMVEQVGDVFRELTPNGSPAQLRVNELPPAFGDRALLRQVVLNMLDNALKYSSKQASPVIEVGGHTAEGETVYCIKDNGAGFDMRFYSKLFGVFQRLHSTQEFPGTGIGLANVQRVILRHGGRVWAESRPGEGASFFFALPCA